MHTPGVKRLGDMWCKTSWAQQFSRKFTTITISPGAKNTETRNTGWCGRARLPHFPGKKGLWAAAWETTESSLKALIQSGRARRCFRPFMALGESCRVPRQKENLCVLVTNGFGRTVSLGTMR